MTVQKRDRIIALLKGIQTGDPESVEVVNEDKYIQHNPQTQEGSEGLAVLFKRLSATNPRVKIVRAFEDGDFVFAHTEYDFANRNIGFEIFRFEDGYAVEHWDNIQRRKGPNSSGNSMVDGATEITDLDKTETNRALVGELIEQVMINGKLDQIADYIDTEHFIEHSPSYSNDINELVEHLSSDSPSFQYQKNHRLLAEGNFVLSVTEGLLEGHQASFFDLFRLQDGKVIEHWDTTEKVPPMSEWKNENGKFNGLSTDK